MYQASAASGPSSSGAPAAAASTISSTATFGVNAQSESTQSQPRATESLQQSETAANTATNTAQRVVENEIEMKESKENDEMKNNNGNNNGETGLTNMLDDVLDSFDIDAPEDTTVTTTATTATTTTSQSRNQTVPRQQQQPQAPVQQRNQPQQQQQQPNLGNLFSNMMSMMSGGGASGGSGGSGGGANDGLAGLMRAFGGAANSNANNNANSNRRDPSLLASRVISFLIGLVGMNEMSAARKGEWDFLKYLRKDCAKFVLTGLLDNVDTPMQRNEICKNLSVGLGTIMMGRYSNDHRQVLKTVTMNVIGNQLNGLMNIVLDSENDSEFGKKVFNWGKTVLSEFVYKLSINFNTRENGAKKYLTHLVKNLMGNLGHGNGRRAVSMGQLQLVDDFVSYFVDTAKAWHLKTLQTQRRGTGSSNSNSRLAQNEQWALQLTDENDRKRWLDTIRRDNQRLPVMSCYILFGLGLFCFVCCADIFEFKFFVCFVFRYL